MSREISLESLKVGDELHYPRDIEFVDCEVDVMLISQGMFSNLVSPIHSNIRTYNKALSIISVDKEMERAWGAYQHDHCFFIWKIAAN